MSHPHLKITSILMLASELETYRPDYVISITDPDGADAGSAESALAMARVPFARLQFHDVERVQGGAIAPTLPALRALRDTLDRDCRTVPERLMIHCHAGISRSPAVGLIALAHFAARSGDLDKEAGRRIARDVFGAQPWAQPNGRLLAIAERLFDEPGEAMVEEALMLQENAVRGPVSADAIW